jgi:hypothetical protein
LPEIHDGGSRRVIETCDSFEPIALWRSSRPIIGRFGVKGDHAYFSPANNGVQAEVLKVIEADPGWNRAWRSSL